MLSHTLILGHCGTGPEGIYSIETKGVFTCLMTETQHGENRQNHRDTLTMTQFPACEQTTSTMCIHVNISVQTSGLISLVPVTDASIKIVLFRNNNIISFPHSRCRSAVRLLSQLTHPVRHSNRVCRPTSVEPSDPDVPSQSCLVSFDAEAAAHLRERFVANRNV